MEPRYVKLGVVGWPIILDYFHSLLDLNTGDNCRYSLSSYALVFLFSYGIAAEYVFKVQKSARR
jgi:hypothetical protein